MDSCRIAEIKVLRLLNENNAISLIYGLPRRNELKDKHVVFVDIGHSKLSAFCAHFKNDKCVIVA